MQPNPDGLRKAILMGADFLAGTPAVLAPQLVESNDTTRGVTVYADREHHTV